MVSGGAEVPSLYTGRVPARAKARKLRRSEAGKLCMRKATMFHPSKSNRIHTRSKLHRSALAAPFEEHEPDDAS